MPNASVDFVAVDFETANASRASACAVGLTVVRGGQVVDTVSWLVKPHESVADFHPLNVSIHGITPAMVEADGVGWGETRQRMQEIIGDLPVIAHNSGFDRSVWNHANKVAGIDELAPDFYCTLSLSRRLSKTGVIAGLDQYRLDVLAEFFGLEQLHHHEAGEDSLMAALVALRLVELVGASSVEDAWGGPTSSGMIRADRVPVPRKVRRNNVPSVVPVAPAPEGIAGETFTLTGGLDAMTREECWAAIEAAGGLIAKSVTKKTTVLVIGAGAEESMPPLLGENRKELKAISLIEAGQRIAVIGEPDLLELLNENLT
ncbi:exonuclease domain-containing protein [Rothia nasimurium]|uniref:exonuclease domain-containing protein n=1 Tax=Rothia nasimurium TaxID=85336 RepID=UPI001F2DD8CE|nr:exonuclease domain-containing protein [Rothia nasimurium]